LANEDSNKKKIVSTRCEREGNNKCIVPTDMIYMLTAGRNSMSLVEALYSSPSILRVMKSRRMIWAGYMSRMEEETGVYRVLVRKPEGKRPLGRPRRRWEDNIRMDFQEVGCGVMTGLA
jgi:hypothetical protein